MKFIINDTITKMYQILGDNPEFDPIKFELKNNIVDIAITVFKEVVNYWAFPKYIEVIKQELFSPLNMSPSDSELNYIIECRSESLKKKVPKFLEMAISVENQIYYEKNINYNICLPLVICILNMIKNIIIEYYFRFEDEEVFFDIDFTAYEVVEEYILYLLDYLNKRSDTIENDVKFFLQDQEVMAPEKGN